LRNDAPALALRGIAMAQLGDLDRAKMLLRRAARTFGSREAVARARRLCSHGRARGGGPRPCSRRHPHMLGHACGYALANKRYDTRAIQAWLGPSDRQKTGIHNTAKSGRRNGQPQVLAALAGIDVGHFSDATSDTRKPAP
jgi:integrase